MVNIPPNLPEEITNIYKIERNTFVKKDTGHPSNKFEIEVGDLLSDGFEPQIKLKRWSNECNASFRLIDNRVNQPGVGGANKKIKYTKKKLETHFYEDGKNYEFEVVLKEKPITNKIEMSIETKGLAFYYQLPLNQENNPNVDYCTETDCYKNDKVVIHRPENVVGSYAVYHSTKRGDYSRMGGKNYRAGKAFHIYRPKIIDSANNWTWGILNIDIPNKILTVEIPQDFLDNAVYPVKHAAGLTFGADPEVPGGSAEYATDKMRGSPYTGAAGTATSMAYYSNDDYGSSHYALGIYKESDKSHVAHTLEGTHSGSGGWKTLNFSSGETIEAINYWLIGWDDGDADWNYDSGDPGDGSLATSSYNYSNWPSEMPYSSVSYLYSIYCTYEGALVTHVGTHLHL